MAEDTNKIDGNSSSFAVLSAVGSIVCLGESFLREELVPYDLMRATSGRSRHPLLELLTLWSVRNAVVPYLTRKDELKEYMRKS